MKVSLSNSASSLGFHNTRRNVIMLACAVCLWTGAALCSTADVQQSNKPAQPAKAPQSATAQNPTSSSAAAYAKYLSEQRDVERYQRKMERKEELQQRKVNNPEADDGANVYRHSAMVQSFGHIVGLSTEMTARLFEVINFLILMAIIVWFVARALPKTLRGRKDRIQSRIDEARVATEDANRRLSEVEQRLARLDGDILAFRAQAEQETAAEEQRLRAALEQEKQKIVDAANQEVTAARLSAQRQLKDFVAEMVIERARRRIEVNLATDRELVAEFVNELDTDRPRVGVN